MRNGELLRRLVAIQDGRTDEAFAVELGLHRASWTQIKNGKRGLGGIALGKVLKRYPELLTALTGSTEAEHAA